MKCPHCSIALDKSDFEDRFCPYCLLYWENWHILPNNDFKDHQEKYNCLCDPEIQYDEGFILIIHNSYDGRKAIEQANDILNS